MSLPACPGCEEAFQGLIAAKIETEERLRQMTHNHSHTLRMYAQERSRNDKLQTEIDALKDQTHG